MVGALIPAPMEAVDLTGERPPWEYPASLMSGFVARNLYVMDERLMPELLQALGGVKAATAALD
jgi:hypothetical protein